MTFEAKSMSDPIATIASGWPSHDQSNSANQISSDHFIVRNGVEYAGTHIIVDLWGAQQIDDLKLMEQTLRRAVSVCRATLLHLHLHHFTPNAGISGVAVLAESHISVHTWPERNFAAFDVFMCGDAKPENAIAIFKAAFRPASVNVSEHYRGAKPLNDKTDPVTDITLFHEANDEAL
jgi:S-adenosylmethionine decarboxylase